MSNTDDPSPAPPSTQPGPDVLTERTLAGIFVHVIGLFTGAIGPGIVYLLSDHEFTRDNARTAINWQLFYFVSFVAVLALFFVAVALDFVLPDFVVVTVLLVVFALFFVVMLLTILNLVFPLVATGKAIFGTAWEYPIAPDFFDLDAERLRVDLNWWRFVAAYALLAPVLFVQLLGAYAFGPPETGAGFGAFFLTLVVTLFVSFVAYVSLYKDVQDCCEAGRPCPNWIPYLGAPAGAYAVVYLGSLFVLRSDNPSGDAIYGYLVVLWAASVAYLYRRREGFSSA
ncbi:DUF4870 domain-containing protein [Natrononativus amylolyticus]|uniref:DUF4870 domain-containing protein n=1 Tax=Natrononativus amylolyticus TaxID=2963434 RepID=UPI0020CB6EDB|nr:DUF4870 domain-containing protein [Natrononativus amylolyticus]